MLSRSEFSSSDISQPQEQTQENAVKARLKWFNPGKGFGFVIPEDNPTDAFLHITQLQKLGVHGLGEGAEILCVIDYGDKGATVLHVLEILDVGQVNVAHGMGFIAANAEQNALEGKTKGLVKWYKPEKGFGFIMSDDGMKDIFVHKTCLDRDGITELYAGQSVRVHYKTVAKGREATSVSIESTP